MAQRRRSFFFARFVNFFLLYRRRRSVYFAPSFARAAYSSYGNWFNLRRRRSGNSTLPIGFVNFFAIARRRRSFYFARFVNFFSLMRRRRSFFFARYVNPASNSTYGSYSNSFVDRRRRTYYFARFVNFFAINRRRRTFFNSWRRRRSYYMTPAYFSSGYGSYVNFFAIARRRRSFFFVRFVNFYNLYRRRRSLFVAARFVPQPGCKSVSVTQSDSSGDGWNGASCTITALNANKTAAFAPLRFQYTYGQNNKVKTSSLCMRNGCYTAQIAGGTWMYEIRMKFGSVFKSCQTSGRMGKCNMYFKVLNGVATSVSKINWTAGKC